MNNQATIPPAYNPSRSIVGSVVILMLLSVITGTFLRSSLLIIYPIMVFLLVYYYRFRLTASVLILFGLIFISFVLSLYPNLFLKYKLLSLFYMLPFVVLFFADPQKRRTSELSTLQIFMNCLTIVAVINNIIGVAQVIQNPNSDDSFRGLYSQYSISLNGLMLINAVLFFYYFCSFLAYRKTVHLFAFIFFGLSANLGFYGAGVIICAIAFILTFFKFTLKSILGTIIISVVTVFVVYFSMLLIKPVALQYNVENIQKLMKLDVQNGPRKLISFYNYSISYPSNVKDFLFGSGPGTYVSRSAFMVGSPTYFQALPVIKDDEQPFYFKNYAYSLWNEKNTIKELYMDGFRNQPFSSVLALLGEYGFVFTLVLAVLFISYFQKVYRLFRLVKDRTDAVLTFRFYKFLMILLPLLFLIDNYLEYPEIILVVVPAIKFAHAALLNKVYNTAGDEYPA